MGTSRSHSFRGRWDQSSCRIVFVSFSVLLFFVLLTGVIATSWPTILIQGIGACCAGGVMFCGDCDCWVPSEQNGCMICFIEMLFDESARNMESNRWLDKLPVDSSRNRTWMLWGCSILWGPKCWKPTCMGSSSTIDCTTKQSALPNLSRRLLNSHLFWMKS